MIYPDWLYTTTVVMSIDDLVMLLKLLFVENRERGTFFQFLEAPLSTCVINSFTSV